MINQSANATLALGASPIMATSPAEMEDLSKFTGALLVNFGTITDKEGMLVAGSSFIWFIITHLFGILRLQGGVQTQPENQLYLILWA